MRISKLRGRRRREGRQWQGQGAAESRGEGGSESRGRRGDRLWLRGAYVCVRAREGQGFGWEGIRGWELD